MFFWKKLERCTKILLTGLWNVLKQLCFANVTMAFSAKIPFIFRVCHEGWLNVLSNVCNAIHKHLQNVSNEIFIMSIILQTIAWSLRRVSIKSNNWSFGDIWRYSVAFPCFQQRHLANVCSRSRDMLILVVALRRYLLKICSVFQIHFRIAPKNVIWFH